MTTETTDTIDTAFIPPTSASIPMLRRPLLLADWQGVTFIHYAVDASLLQPLVPFELDRFNGLAYISLVAFTQRRLRPGFGGPVVAAMCAPLASHPFLNVRTYVRHGSDRGIYFLAEWIPNRLAKWLGPLLYGLPYRLGRLEYSTPTDSTALSGIVTAPDVGILRFEGEIDRDALPIPVHDPLEHFLLERYVAFTRNQGVSRRFCIRHEPWLHVRANIQITEDSLIHLLGQAWKTARPVGAHYAPGLRDVWIGPPQRVANHRTDGNAIGEENPVVPEDVRTNLEPHVAVAATPVFVAPLLVRFVRNALPAWAVMWLIALALFAAAKWLTWLRAVQNMTPVPKACSLAYLFAWVGMDAAAFLRTRPSVPRPTTSQWIEGLAKTVLGAGLIWGVVRIIPPSSPMLRGWVGMIGLTLLLHFGTFELLALLWRRAGVDARPLMNQPIRSRTLAEFWGGRWNRGFHQLVETFCYRPLQGVLGPGPAMIATFGVSGLVHDLIISLPAGGGFGGPTLYFLLQSAGVGLERTPPLRRLRRVHPWFGRLFAMAFTLGPAAMLFHGPFVRKVILPFFGAIGAAPAEACRLPAVPYLRLDLLLLLGGGCHFGILLASALVPSVLDWRRELRPLSPLSRQLVWTHGAFIVLVIIGFGAVSVLNAHSLADGSALARSVCGLVAIFWLTRLAIQFFVFDAGPFLKNVGLKVGYHALTVVFAYLGIVYAWAALAGSRG